MTPLEQEILTVVNQIVPTIEKAFYDVFVLRHPGHANQKTHGNRFGAGQAKESLRRLKDDKGAREKYKETHRKLSQSDPKKMSNAELQVSFGGAKTATQRAKIADELLGRSNYLKDKTVAKTSSEVPQVNEYAPSPRTIGAKGKNAVFLDDNGAYSIGPIVKNNEGDFVAGTFGRVRQVKPEFINDNFSGADRERFQFDKSLQMVKEGKVSRDYLKTNLDAVQSKLTNYRSFYGSRKDLQTQKKMIEQLMKEAK